MNLKFDDLPEAIQELLIEQDTRYEIALGALMKTATSLREKGVDPISFGKALATCLGATIAATPKAVRPLLRTVLVAEMDRIKGEEE